MLRSAGTLSPYVVHEGVFEAFRARRAGRGEVAPVAGVVRAGVGEVEGDLAAERGRDHDPGAVVVVSGRRYAGLGDRADAVERIDDAVDGDRLDVAGAVRAEGIGAGAQRGIVHQHVTGDRRGRRDHAAERVYERLDVVVRDEDHVVLDGARIRTVRIRVRDRLEHRRVHAWADADREHIGDRRHGGGDVSFPLGNRDVAGAAFGRDALVGGLVRDAVREERDHGFVGDAERTRAVVVFVDRLLQSDVVVGGVDQGPVGVGVDIGDGVGAAEPDRAGDAVRELDKLDVLDLRIVLDQLAHRITREADPVVAEVGARDVDEVVVHAARHVDD